MKSFLRIIKLSFLFKLLPLFSFCSMAIADLTIAVPLKNESVKQIVFSDWKYYPQFHFKNPQAEFKIVLIQSNEDQSHNLLQCKGGQLSLHYEGDWYNARLPSSPRQIDCGNIEEFIKMVSSECPVLFQINNNKNELSAIQFTCAP